MMLYTVAILIVHAALSVQGNPFQKIYPADDIEALCADKRVDLVSITELKNLNSIVGGSTCPSNVKAAIPDLLALIEQTKDNVCSQESIDKLRDFYSKYLDTSSKENKHREQLPRSLKKFALAYGMQMSSSCKERLIGVLRTKRIITLHRALKGLLTDTSPVAKMLEGLSGPDKILLPGDLAPFIKDMHANPDDNVIYMQSKTAPYIRDMQANCNNIFAPIYRPLIKPVVQLANMGFNYKGFSVRFNMASPRILTLMARWSRLVYLCESLNNIYMVDIPDQANTKGLDSKAVRVLTKDEAAALEGKSVTELQPQVVEAKYAAIGLDGDVIIDKNDKRLKKAIKAFSTSKSENEKVAKRMMGTGLSMLKAQIKRFNIGFLLSTGYKSLAQSIRTGKSLKPTDEIVKALDASNGHESEFHDFSPSFDWAGTWEETKDLSLGLGKILFKIFMFIIGVVLFIPCSIIYGFELIYHGL